MQLRELQTEFQNYILHNQQNIKKTISSEIGLEIYYQAYRLRLERALADNYPVLKLFLGNQDFSQLSQDYIKNYDSNYFSIRYFGDKLSYFLPEFSFLSELAEFEWLISLAFDSPDSEHIVNFSEIAELSPAVWRDMRLQMQPFVYRIDLNYNTVKIWQAILEKQINIESPQKQSLTPWIIWRQGLMTRYCALSIEEAFAIDSVITQHSFGEICQGLCQWKNEQEVGPLTASFLKNWLSGELIAKVII